MVQWLQVVKHHKYVTLVWCHALWSSQKCLEVMIITTAMSCTKAVCAHCIHAHQDVEKTMTKMKISVPYTFKKICLDTQIFVNEEKFTNKSWQLFNQDDHCTQFEKLRKSTRPPKKIIDLFDSSEKSFKYLHAILHAKLTRSFQGVKKVYLRIHFLLWILLSVL